MEATSNILPIKVLFTPIKGLSHNVLSPETSNHPRICLNDFKQPFPSLMVQLALKAQFSAHPTICSQAFWPQIWNADAPCRAHTVKSCFGFFIGVK